MFRTVVLKLRTELFGGDAIVTPDNGVILLVEELSVLFQLAHRKKGNEKILRFRVQILNESYSLASLATRKNRR